MKNCKIYTTYLIKIFLNITTLSITLRALLKEENPLTQEPNKQTKTLNILNTKQNEITKFLYSVQLQILLAKYYIYTSKYKQHRPNFVGFKNILKQRKEIEHYNALSKDKLDYHNQKLGFLGTVL